MFDGAGVRRGGRWLAVALALSCGAVRGEGRAAAQPAGQTLAETGRVQLVYTVPKNVFGCDSEATFRKLAANGVERRSTDPFALTGPPTHLMNVTFSVEPEGFRGLVELRDAAGKPVWTRQIFERTCARVIDYLTLVIALDVFPESCSIRRADHCWNIG